MLKRARRQSSPPAPAVAVDPAGNDLNSATDDMIGIRSDYLQGDQMRKYRYSDEARARTVIRCDLPPHEPLSFASLEQYEVHYQQFHVNRCLECKKNFPTDHFLSLHITENHDPLVATRRDRGNKTFACFVEGCDKVCLTRQKRNMHLVDKHCFPRDYDFFIINDGIDHRSSLLRSQGG